MATESQMQMNLNLANKWMVSTNFMFRIGGQKNSLASRMLQNPIVHYDSTVLENEMVEDYGQGLVQLVATNDVTLEDVYGIAEGMFLTNTSDNTQSLITAVDRNANIVAVESGAGFTKGTYYVIMPALIAEGNKAVPSLITKSRSVKNNSRRYTGSFDISSTRLSQEWSVGGTVDGVRLPEEYKAPLSRMKKDMERVVWLGDGSPVVAGGEATTVGIKHYFDNPINGLPSKISVVGAGATLIVSEVENALNTMILKAEAVGLDFDSGTTFQLPQSWYDLLKESKLYKIFESDSDVGRDPSRYVYGGHSIFLEVNKILTGTNTAYLINENDFNVYNLKDQWFGSKLLGAVGAGESVFIESEVMMRFKGISYAVSGTWTPTTPARNQVSAQK